MQGNQEIDFYVGLDVQIKRACSYFVLDPQLECVDSGWLKGNTFTDICNNFADVLKRFEETSSSKLAVGIDAPRMALTKPREFYWQGEQWRKRRSADKGRGRHCEVVLKALNIANPQWTPLANKAPSWMQLGFNLFEALQGSELVFEVFPSASYYMLRDRKQPRVSIHFASFVYGPKDMLDACIAALTVHEFITGRGSEVGGGDGLGTIVLPTKLPVSPSHPVLHWPDEGQLRRVNQ